MSLETLRFFAELLEQVQLPAAHPDFETMAQRIITVRSELETAIEEAVAADGAGVR